LSEDALNSELTGTDLVVELCYGKAKSSDYKECGGVIVDRLRSEHRVQREELMRELGFDPRSENDVSKFQRRIKSLINKDDGGFFRVADSRRKNGDTYYFLSRGRFDEVLDRIVQNVRNTIDSKPREEVEELKQENRELRERIEELENRLDNLHG